MALLTAEEQKVVFERIRQAIVYPYEELFGRFLGDESLQHAGNVSSPAFPTTFKAGQVWVIDHVGVFNGSGGAIACSAAITFNAPGSVSHSIDIDRSDLPNLHHESLLPHPIYIDDDVSTTLFGGGATENVSVHARRIL